MSTRSSSRSIALVLLLAACGGGDDAVLRGTLAQAPEDPSAWSVRVGGADAGVPLEGADFAVDELPPGPATVLLVRDGRTVGAMELEALPPGARVRLAGIRWDEASGRAFPADVELSGARTIHVNGIRMAPSARLPASVDARGAVLGVDHRAGTLLLRPADESLPDLRVVLSPETEGVTTEGDAVPLFALGAGDTVTVAGPVSGGFVAARRVEVPPSMAWLAGAGEEERAGDGGGETEGDAVSREADRPGADGDADAPAVVPARPVARPPVAPRERERAKEAAERAREQAKERAERARERREERREPGRGRGNGGKEKGRGN